MSSNRFPGYLTLLTPMGGTRPAMPTHIAQHRRYERPAADRDEFGVATRHSLLLQLDTVGDLAPSAPLSFVVVRLPGLDVLNREEGTARGDEALRMVANTIRSITRATDTVGRISGGSFGIVLQGTGSIGATAVAARLAHHLDRALQGFSNVRAEVGTATGTGVNAGMLPVAAMDAFPADA